MDQENNSKIKYQNNLQKIKNTARQKKIKIGPVVLFGRERWIIKKIGTKHARDMKTEGLTKNIWKQKNIKVGKMDK